MIGVIANWAIFAFGAGGAYLLARQNGWGVICALFAQPFWFYIAWTGEQWGMFAVSFVYTGNWLIGVYNWWVLPARVRRCQMVASPAVV